MAFRTRPQDYRRIRAHILARQHGDDSDDEHRDELPIYKSRELFATFISSATTMDGIGKDRADPRARGSAQWVATIAERNWI